VLTTEPPSTIALFRREDRLHDLHRIIEIALGGAKRGHWDMDNVATSKRDLVFELAAIEESASIDQFQGRVRKATRDDQHMIELRLGGEPPASPTASIKLKLPSQDTLPACCTSPIT
jgi:hypothetical protein